MKKIWTLTYESIPGDGVQEMTFKSFDDVKRTVRELISQIGIQHYTAGIRDGINVPYREAMACFIEDYVSRKDFFRAGDVLPSDDIFDYPYEAERIKNGSDTFVDDDWYDEDDETDELDDFCITIGEDELVFECGNELSLLTNMVVMDNDEESYEFKFFASGAPENKFRELTIELELTKNQPWGTSAYPVLILQALQDSREHLSQQTIASLTSIERKAVGRNIALLKEIGYDIRHDKQGYYIPKASCAIEKEDLQIIIESIQENVFLDEDRKRALIEKLAEL